MLLKLVNLNGPANWVDVSRDIKSRTAKQCRERYHQNLKPSLDHNPITEEEGRAIERLVGEMGPRWAEISRRLPGRSDNAVKNWWNGGVNRRKREGERNGEGGERSSKRRKASDAAAPQPSGRGGLTRFSRTITVPSSSSSQRTDRVVLSPMSDKTPSLVSDHGSRFSQSPRVDASPSVELEHNPFARRNSRPNFHVPGHYGMSYSSSTSPIESRLAPSYQHKPPSALDGLQRLVDATTSPRHAAPLVLPAPRPMGSSAVQGGHGLEQTLQSVRPERMRPPTAIDLPPPCLGSPRSEDFAFRFPCSSYRRPGEGPRSVSSVLPPLRTDAPWSDRHQSPNPCFPLSAPERRASFDFALHRRGSLPSLAEAIRPAPPLFSPSRAGAVPSPTYSQKLHVSSIAQADRDLSTAGERLQQQRRDPFGDVAYGKSRDTRMNLANVLT
jgi:Myb-like DNA-binding protein FlbD